MKIYTSFPFPFSKEDVRPIEKYVKKETGIKITISYYEWEEDNQTGFFEVEEEFWKKVVKAIHDFGDSQCFFSPPNLHTVNGLTYGWTNCIEDADLI